MRSLFWKSARSSFDRVLIGYAAAMFAAAAFVLLPATVFGQREYPISGIQGNKNMSAREREIVKTSGIVTARTRTGFFIQTPDDKVDNDPLSSEGVFIYTRDEPGSEATLGNMVVVSGMVTEFRPRAEPASLPITEISMQKGRDVVQVLSKDNPLPKPMVLVVDDFKLNSIDQLEKYEGMRVTVAELTVTAPTGGRVDNKNNTSESNGTLAAESAIGSVAKSSAANCSPLARPSPRDANQATSAASWDDRAAFSCRG